MAAVSAVHIYFPDPWPKRKHHRRRLINQPFPDIAERALIPGGVIYLRTDNADYFAQMEDVFGGKPNFQACETPQSLAELLTDFERDYRARGIATLRAAYRRA